MPRQQSSRTDELRPEYDLSQLTGRVKGKYFKRVTASSNVVLLEPDIAKAFPNARSVNTALRLLLQAAGAGNASSRRKQA